MRKLAPASIPSQDGAEVARNRLQQPDVEVHAELVWDGYQQGVRGGDRGVPGELLHELAGFADIAAPEAGQPAVEVAHLVPGVGLGTQSEVSPGIVIDQGNDASRYGHPGGAPVASGRPGLPVTGNLLGLQLIEGNPGVLRQQRR